MVSRSCTFYWYVGLLGQKARACEGLGSCLTLSSLLMDLDCQKLWRCLSKCFFVDSSLLTKIMYQNNYLKIEHSEIRNSWYSHQKLRPRCHLQGETPIEVSATLIHHLWTFWMDLMCDIHRQFTATWSNFCDTKATTLFSLNDHKYIRFLGRGIHTKVLEAKIVTLCNS